MTYKPIIQLIYNKPYSLDVEDPPNCVYAKKKYNITDTKNFLGTRMYNIPDTISLHR